MNTPRPVFPLVAVLALAASAAPALATERVLYSNGNRANPADTGLLFTVGTASGVFAPPGFQWSEVQATSPTEANSAAGFSNLALPGSGFRFADDFTVPPGIGWDLARVTFFVYAPGYAQSTPPVTGVSLRVWSGPPGEPGSTIIFGNSTTNRFYAGVPMDAYRVFSTYAAPATAPDTSRRLWAVDASFSGLHLDPGVYWLDWQMTSADPTVEAFSPAVTIAGTRSPAGANARQMLALPPPATEGTWAALLDPGKPTWIIDVPQELPFLLIGDDVPPPCLADVTDIGDTGAGPDGILTVDDIIAFVNAFGDATGCPGVAPCNLADVTDIGNSGAGPDGELTVDDIIAFVNNFGAGCG